MLACTKLTHSFRMIGCLRKWLATCGMLLHSPPLLGALISFVDFPCKEMPDYALDRSDNPQGDTPQGEEQFIISDSEHESDSSSSDAKDPCDASGSSGDAQELFASNLLRMAPHLF